VNAEVRGAFGDPEREILPRHDTGDHVGALLRPVAAASGTSAGGQIGFQAVRDLRPGNPA
jgi:hypothetical protein